MGTGPEDDASQPVSAQAASPPAAARPDMSPDPVLTEAEVIAAFRFAFHTDPRPVDVAWHRRHWSFDQLRATFFATPLFTQVNRHLLRASTADYAVLLENGMTAWIDANDLYVGPAMARGGWERAETAFMLSRLRPGDCMVDIGAMLGWFTLHAADAVGPTGAVFAFEPQPHMHALLRRSVLANRLESWVMTHQIALADRAGDARLQADPPAPAETLANHGHVWIAPVTGDTAEAAGVLCQTARLDDMALQRKIDFIKIDVEGAENLVFSGAERTIRESRPIIMSEFFPEQLEAVSGTPAMAVLERLQSWGYRAFVLTPEGRPRPWTEADMPSGAGVYTTVVFM